jgi:DNA-binding transcriptional MerR regulator
MKNYKSEIPKDLGSGTQIFKMKEVIERLNVTPRTVRYYESEGLVGDVKRSLGFTRYFTESDINRLREVLTLKQKGYKISDIKEIFAERYPKNEVLDPLDVSIQDALLDANDLKKCAQYNVDVVKTELVFDHMTVSHTDWQNVQSTEFLKPFKMNNLNKPKNKTYISVPTNTASWTGCGHRAIAHYILNKRDEVSSITKNIPQYIDNLTEWFILPVEYSMDYRYLTDLEKSIIVEKRHHNVTESVILFESELERFLEKEIKDASLHSHRLVQQVLFQCDPKGPHYTWLTSLIHKSVPHKDILKIEPVFPAYRESVGTLHGSFLALF